MARAPDMAMDAKARNSLLLFLTLTFGLSSIFYVRIFSGASLQRTAPLLMWPPGVAAIVAQVVFYGSLAGFGWRRAPGRYLAFAVLLPIGYCLAIYVPVWLTGLGGFNA